jgi:hypothetical protein
MSNSISKVFGAGLLTLAVVGGTATYLAGSLHAVPTTVLAVGLATEQAVPQQQRHAEVIVTEGQAS